ncbi:RHS repeat-associated core domain-containing protein [Catenulispora subtropica]|uniref:DUF6531 domain-containing protein n=1 Tax=Catenulispora subtropica TaxID=450798 RepID=A0ABP5C4T3_9ACTN
MTLFVTVVAVLVGMLPQSPVTAWSSKAPGISLPKPIPSKPLPPGQVSKAAGAAYVPRPTQASDAASGPRHDAIARAQAAVTARSRPLKPAAGPVLPPELAERQRHLQDMTDRHLVGKSEQRGEPTTVGPALDQLPATVGSAARHVAQMTAASSNGYGATYSSAANFDVVPTYYSPGRIWVTVTNTSNFTWNTNFALGYHLYNADGSVYNFRGFSSALSAPLAPGQYTTLYAGVQFLPAGSFKLVWDMEDDSGTFFTDYGVPASQALAFTVPHYPPTATISSPAAGASLDTLLPQLVITVGADGTKQTSDEFRVCTASDPAAGTCWDSGWRALTWSAAGFSVNDVWKPPAGALYWNRTYYWQVRVQDSTATTPWSEMSPLETVVTPDPLGNVGPGHADPAGVDLFQGDYTRTDTDISVPVFDTSITVGRTYNSADAAVGVFGAGWSSLLDLRQTTASDGSMTVAYPDGRRLRYEKNPDGSWAAPFGESDEGASVSKGSIRMPDGTYYSFDSSGVLSGITTPSYDQITVARNAAGQITAFNTALRSVYVLWNSGGTVASLSSNGANPAQRLQGVQTWTYGYSGNHLASVCGPRSDILSCTTFDNNGPGGLLSGLHAPNGGGEVTTISYDSGGSGRVTSVRFPNSGSPTGDSWLYQKLDPVDSEAAFTIQVQTPAGVLTDYEYGPSGNLWTRWTNTATPQPWNSRYWTYDAFGRVAGMTDENSNVTEYYYDGWGRLATVDGYRDNATIVSRNYQYWTSDAGQPPNPSDARWGKLVQSTDPDGAATVQTFNTFGLLSTATAPPTAAAHAGAKTTYAYTCEGTGTWGPNLGPPVVNDPWQSQVGQPCGLLASVTDPMGRVTRYSYDSVGEQTRIVTPTGTQTDLTYDGFGHVVRKVVSGVGGPGTAETDFTYDGSGHVLTELDPAVTNSITGVAHQKKTTNGYDADGNLLTSTTGDTTATTAGGDPARTTEYTYDQRGRRTRTKLDGVVTAQTSYDGMGNVTSSTDGVGAVYSYAYTPQGWLGTISLTNFVDDPTVPTAPRTVPLAIYYYDHAGRLAATTDPMGHVVDYTYSPDNLKLTETFESYRDTPSAAPRQLVLHQYTYDKAGNIVKDAAGDGARVTTTGYDSRGSVQTTTVDPGGLNRTTSTTFNADEQPLVTTLTDGTRTETATKAYTADGRLWQSAVHNDATPDLVTQYARDATGQIVASTDPRGGTALGSTAPPDPAFTATSAFDNLERLVSMTAPTVQVEDGTGQAATAANPTAARGYDTFGELTDVKDPKGATTHTVYDDHGRRTEVDYPTSTESDGTVVSPKEKWTYDGDGNVLTHTDRLGQVTKYDYDRRNRAYRITAPAAAAGAAPGVTRLAWNDDGHLLSTIDPTGAQTLRTYDVMERLSTIVEVERYVSGTTTPAQYTTTYTYDPFGDVLKVATADASDTRTYDKTGALLTDTPADRGTTTYTRDVAGRPVSVKDPLGRHTDTKYDLAGRRTSETSYDATGAVVAVRSYVTDKAGNVTSVTDPNNQVWQTSYNALNQATLLTDPAPTDAGGTVQPAPTTAFGYDLDGDRSRVTDANGHATHTTHNVWGLPSVTTAPATAAQPDTASRQWTTDYNAAGLPTTQVQPGGVTVTSAYDLLGRLTGQTGTGSEGLTMARQFGYDLDGRLTSLNALYGTETIAYNDRGLLAGYSHGSFSGDGTDTYLYQYDADDRLTSRSGAAGTTNFTYDGANAVSTVNDPLTGGKRTFHYDAAGQLTKENDTTSAGLTGPSYQYNYDGLGRPTTEFSYAASGTLNGSINYGWDPNGNLTSTGGFGLLATEPSRTYTYDADNRLISSKDVTSQTDYGWDGAGNRTSVTTWTLSGGTKINPIVTTAAYDQRNRLLSTSSPQGTSTYQWQPRGPLASQTTTPAGGPATTTTSQSDAFNQLLGDGPSATYSYDALGRVTTAGYNIVQYDGLDREPVADGAWLYARDLAGGPIAAKPATGGVAASSLLRNIHGDVMAAADPATGNVQSSQSFGPFGEPVSHGAGMAPLGFQGGWTSPATGHVLAQSRWYSPGTGGFLSQDSAPGGIGAAADANLYAYGSGNPTSRVDRNGHDWWGDITSTVSDTFDEVTSGIGDTFDQVYSDFADSVGGWLESVTDAIPEVAEAVGGALADAGVDIAAGAACIIGCLEALVVGAVVVVVVAGVYYYMKVDADGSLSVDNGADPASDANTNVATGTNVATNPNTGTAPGTGTTPGAGPANPAADPGPPAPPPVVVTGTATNTQVKTWSTVTQWYDDTYLYTRTDKYVQTTTTVTTYYSDGSWTTNTNTVVEHTWETISQLLIDLDNPIVLPTPGVGTARTPVSGQGVAAADGTCGSGGALTTCAQAADGPQVPGLLDFGGAGEPKRCLFLPDGFQCTADGNWLNQDTGETICAPGGGPACVHRGDLCTAEGTTTVYRVEGSGNERIRIVNGNPLIRGAGKPLFLNFGKKARADYWLAKRLAQGYSDTQIKSFDVSSSFLDQLRQTAVPENMASDFPDAPLRVDVTKAADQYMLRPQHIAQMFDAIIPDTGSAC